MKSFSSFLIEVSELNCAEQSTIVWKGAVKDSPLCNFKDGIVWQGATQSTPLFNIKSGVIWNEAVQSKVIANFKNGILWEGMVQEKPICNMRENIVWQGALQIKGIANFSINIPQSNPCNFENLFAWRDMVKSSALFNSSTKLSNHMKMALVYWFLMRSTKSVNKKTASGVKPKAVKTAPKSK